MTPEHVINRAIGRAGGYVVVETDMLAYGFKGMRRFHFIPRGAPRPEGDWACACGYLTRAEAWAAATAAVVKAKSRRRNSLASQARALFGPAPCAPARLRECLDALGWSARYVAQITSRDERTVRRWLAGRVTVPWQIDEWLESRARAAERTPPPRKDAA